MRRENGSPIRLEMGLVNPELEPGRFKSSPWQNTNGNGNGNGRKAQRQVLFLFCVSCRATLRLPCLG